MNRAKITEIARSLRKNPTKSEKLFWEYIRKKRFKGLRFLRQFPLIHEGRNGVLYFYIADFYCSKHQLVIELDGKVHEYQKDYDFNRDYVIHNMGINVLRFKNEELDTIDSVLLKIETTIDRTSLRDRVRSKKTNL